MTNEFRALSLRIFFTLSTIVLPTCGMAEYRTYSQWGQDAVIYLPSNTMAENVPGGKRYYSLPEGNAEITVKGTNFADLEGFGHTWKKPDDYKKSLDTSYKTLQIKSAYWQKTETNQGNILTGKLLFFKKSRLIEVSYHVPAKSEWSDALDSLEVIWEPRIYLKTSTCIDDGCICVGNNGAYYEGHLNEIGPDLKHLLKGVNCLAADFDGNGFTDFVISGGEGTASLHFTGPNGWIRAVHFEPGLPLKIFPPHSSIENLNPGILVSDEVESVVYLWESESLAKHILTSNKATGSPLTPAGMTTENSK